MSQFLNPSWRIFVFLIFVTGLSGVVLELKKIGALTAVLRSHSVNSGQNDGSVYGTSQFSDELKLLLEGELTAPNNVKRWESGHLIHPDSPLHYARFLTRSDSLPDDFREVVNRMAPANAWFDFWEIHKLADRAFQENAKKTKRNSKGKTIPYYEILDEEKMKELVSLFHQAAEKEFFSDYFLEQQEMLLSELPKPTLWHKEMVYRFHILSLGQSVSCIMTTGKLISASIQYYIDNDDYDGLVKVEKSSIKLAHQIHANAEELIGALVCQACLQNLYEQLEKAFQHFKKQDVANKYGVLHRKLTERKERIREINNESDESEMMALYGSMMSNIFFTPTKFSASPRKLQRGDLLPSCRAENAVIARMLTTACSIFFAILGLLFWFAALKIGKNLHSATSCQRSHFGTKNRWRILFLGSLIPFCLFLAIRYLTPLGQLGYGRHSSTGGVHLVLPFVALTFLLLSTSLVVTRQVEASKPCSFRIHWALIGLPIAAIVLVGLYHPFMQAKWLIYVSVTLSLIGAIILLFSISKKSDRKSVMCHLLWPPFLLTGGLFGILIFPLIEEERIWISRDQHFKPSSFFVTLDEKRATQNFITQLEQYLP